MLMLGPSLRFACEICVRGHRSSFCKHRDRSLLELRPKGRPSALCRACKGKRSSDCIDCCVSQLSRKHPIVLATGQKIVLNSLSSAELFQELLGEGWAISVVHEQRNASLSTPSSTNMSGSDLGLGMGNATLKVSHLLNPCTCEQQSGKQCLCCAASEDGDQDDESQCTSLNCACDHSLQHQLNELSSMLPSLPPLSENLFSRPVKNNTLQLPHLLHSQQSSPFQSINHSSCCAVNSPPQSTHNSLMSSLNNSHNTCSRENEYITVVQEGCCTKTTIVRRTCTGRQNLSSSSSTPPTTITSTTAFNHMNDHSFSNQPLINSSVNQQPYSFTQHSTSNCCTPFTNSSTMMNDKSSPNQINSTSCACSTTNVCGGTCCRPTTLKSSFTETTTTRKRSASIDISQNNDYSHGDIAIRRKFFINSTGVPICACGCVKPTTQCGDCETDLCEELFFHSEELAPCSG